MKNSTKTFLWQETFKAAITFIAIVGAAAISFNWYERKLLDQQQATAEAARHRQVQYAVAEELLESANTLVFQSQMWKVLSRRMKYFRSLDPDENQVDLFISTYLENSSFEIIKLDEWSSKSILAGIQAQTILGDEVVDSYNNLSEEITKNFDKMEKILDTGAYLYSKYSKNGALFGKDLIKAESLISAYIGSFDNDQEKIFKLHREFISTLAERGYLGKYVDPQEG